MSRREVLELLNLLGASSSRYEKRLREHHIETSMEFQLMTLLAYIVKTNYGGKLELPKFGEIKKVVYNYALEYKAITDSNGNEVGTSVIVRSEIPGEVKPKATSVKSVKLLEGEVVKTKKKVTSK